MLRKFIWSLIWHVMIGWPVSALTLLAFGYDPAHIRRLLSWYLVFWAIFDLIGVAWSAWVWPHLRHWRVRSPFYRPIELIMIGVDWTEEQKAAFMAAWAKWQSSPVYRSVVIPADPPKRHRRTTSRNLAKVSGAGPA